MYHSRTIEVDNNSSLYLYFQELCVNYKNMYNTTNYYIRNNMTGIKKDPHKRQHNEIEVLHDVFTNIRPIYNIKKRTLSKKKDLSDEELELKLQKLLLKEKSSYPSESNWFLSYDVLNGIFKETNNSDYRSLPAQVSQCAIKECVRSWESYFESLKDYKVNPCKYTGKPRLPHYKKNKLSTATLTNGVCKLKLIDGIYYLSFPKTNEKLCLGNYINENDKLAEVKLVPFCGHFKVVLIFDDKEEEKVLTKSLTSSSRIFSIDLGVNNFATISNNIGINPIIIKGGFMKSRNQYFNKRRSELLSKVQKGYNSSVSIKETKRLNSLSRKRSNFFRDCFYKIAHLIVDEAKRNNIDTIIVGRTKFWKQESNIGKINNQNLVSIPYEKFIQILKYLCIKNDIFFDTQEESYTSKASFLDNDFIPSYDSKKSDSYSFSGIREKRGIYKSKNDILINADINGASNILRKYYIQAFDNISDLSYLYTSVKIYNYKDFYTV